MERKDQGCILTDTALGAVASVPGVREQAVAGGAGEGLLGPEWSVGRAWQQGPQRPRAGRWGGRRTRTGSLSTGGPVPVLLGARGPRRSSPGQQLGGRTAWASAPLEVWMLGRNYMFVTSLPCRRFQHIFWPSVERFLVLFAKEGRVTHPGTPVILRREQRTLPSIRATLQTNTVPCFRSPSCCICLVFSVGWGGRRVAPWIFLECVGHSETITVRWHSPDGGSELTGMVAPGERP